MRTVLVTGGSRGIGAAAVSAFHDAGYRAAFFYRANEAAARDVAARTGACPIRCDVTDPAAVLTACREAERELGHIDALVNNAGIAQQKLFQNTTDEDWRRMLDTHLSGAFYVTRAVLPGMLARKAGRIVNVSSIWGRVGASMEVAYSAAKAGLIGMTKALAREVGPSGVTVNCVCPGVIQTDMLASFTPADLDALRDDIPLCRLGVPQDVAQAIVFLCSDAASYITAQVLSIDGGQQG